MRLIPLTNGYTAVVDDEDYPQLIQHNWRAARGHKGMIYARDPGGVNMANLVLTGSPGIRDHKDGNGLNNCRGNLRLASNAQNCRNKRPSGQSSKFKGVSRVSRSRTLWTARIWLGNFGTTLGSFNTQSAAAIAYDVAALTIFKEFAWLNTAHFPELTRVERGILCAMFRG